MKLLHIIVQISLILTVALASDIHRGFKVNTTAGKTISLYNNSYALIIGISDYDNWKDLPNAVKDADAVANELGKIGFEVTKLTDNTTQKPTRNNILNALNNLQQKAIDDRIVIYYAGHGNSVPIPHKENYYNGYLIPSDAQKNKISSYISMNNIKDITMMYNAKHVLYLFDSCFSGHFVDITRADNEPASIITEKISKPVRQVISAGTAEQEASDGVFHSPFCEALLDNFQNMSGDYNKDGYITGEELSFDIRQQVKYETRGDQTPEYGKMKGFKEGDFIFSMSVTPGGTPPNQKGKQERLVEEARRRKDNEARRRKASNSNSHCSDPPNNYPSFLMEKNNKAYIEGKRTYSTIKTAIINAEKGDVIFLSPGTFNTQIVMKSGLTLHGAGCTRTRIVYTSDDWIIKLNDVHNVEIAYLFASHSLPQDNCASGVFSLWHANNVNIHHNNIHGSGIVGVFLDFSEEITIQNNKIFENQQAGIFFSWNNKSVRVLNNIIVDNVGPAILILRSNRADDNLLNSFTFESNRMQNNSGDIRYEQQ